MDMAQRLLKSGKKRKPAEVRGRSQVPPKQLSSISTLEESIHIREEDDFLFVDTEDSAVRKLQFEVQSLTDDNEVLQKHAKEVELQCRVEDPEKQTYRDNQIQARMEEGEAKLEALTLEKRRLESENCVLKTQMESQQRTFEQTTEHQAFRIYLLESEGQVMTERIQQLEEANKLFVMVANNVKEDLWKGQQSGESTETTVCGALQGLSRWERVVLPPDVTLPDDANIPPVSMETLVEFIPEMSPKWEFIGHKLGLTHKVMALRISDQPAESKCLAMLSEWVQSGREVTWQHLLKVLTNSGILLYAVAAKIRQHLMDQAS